MKVDTLRLRNDANIMSTVNDYFFEDDEKFTFDNGLNIAIGFTAYDDDREVVLDPTYGELVWNSYTWGDRDDGKRIIERTPLEMHSCTDEELGLTEDKTNSKFL